MALLQHSSLYESMASWLSSAQKKVFGNTAVGRVLRMSAFCWLFAVWWCAQCKLLQVVGKRRCLGVCCGVGHGERRRMRGCGECRLQRKGSSLCEDFSPLMDYKWGQSKVIEGWSSRVGAGEQAGGVVDCRLPRVFVSQRRRVSRDCQKSSAVIAHVTSVASLTMPPLSSSFAASHSPFALRIHSCVRIEPSRRPSAATCQCQRIAVPRLA
jgi:hypothetical protein